MKKLLVFLLGAGTGSVVTWYITKERYKAIANEEIKSVVETFKRRIDKVLDEEKTKIKEDISKSSEKPYHETVEELGYATGIDTSDGHDYTVITNENLKEGIAPYIISEDEIGNNDYEQRTLIYCADGTIIDEDDEIIVDPEIIIGDALDNMGEFDDALCVRNDNDNTDYIILKSEKTYNEITPKEDS